jgi:hypothetical protein
MERLVMRALTDRPEDAHAVLEILEAELKRQKTFGPNDQYILERMDALRAQLRKAIAPRRRPS